MFKNFVQAQLIRYVKKYFKKHPEVKLVVVAGSIGKTSTKRAIATILSQKYRVTMHEGNHNMAVSAPLAILGLAYPEKVKSIGAWLKVFAAARKRISEPMSTDVIVAELGADHPGDIEHFAGYLKPDIGVVTAVTPEHMEFFKTLDAVAQEELKVANMSKLALINRDDIAGEFAKYLTNSNVDTYGTTGLAEFRFEIKDFTVESGYKGSVIMAGFAEPEPATVKVIGEHSLRPVMGAVAVGIKLGMSPSEVAEGLKLVRATPGRMNVLRGVEGSMIIDDSYNSSPLAASAALQTLYTLQVPQRIAILGTMNELGETSAKEHEALGALCDPTLLDWVITVGDEAEKYLAPAARKRGCQVRSFKSAIDAGSFAHRVLAPGAAVLAKGSQGGVYLEEAVKIIAMMTEGDQLVRQSPQWLEIKNKFFSKFS